MNKLDGTEDFVELDLLEVVCVLSLAGRPHAASHAAHDAEQEHFDMSLEELTESTGYDRTSILAALCVIALQKGGAQLPAVKSALIGQGTFCHNTKRARLSVNTYI